MIKTLILSGALLVAPVQNEEVQQVEEPQIVEETPAEVQEEERFDWKAWAEQWFSPQQITTIAGWITALGAVLGFAIKVKSLAKKDQLTQANLKELISKNLNDIFGDEIKPTLEKVEQTLLENKRLTKLLSEIVALAQDDSYASRFAILELIAQLGIVDDSIIQEAKESIEEEKEEEEAKKEQAKEEIKQIIEDTSENEEEVDGLRI